MTHREFRDYDEDRNDEYFRESTRDRYEKEKFSNWPTEHEWEEGDWPEEDR